MSDCCVDLFTVAVTVTVLLLTLQAHDLSSRLSGCLLCRLGRLAPQYLGRDIFELVLQFLQRQRRVLRLLPLIAQRFTVTQGTCNDGILSPTVRCLRLRTLTVSGQHSTNIGNRTFIFCSEDTLLIVLRLLSSGKCLRQTGIAAPVNTSGLPHRNHATSPYPLKSKFWPTCLSPSVCTLSLRVLKL